jgi:CRISPR/Cas system CSM-associated protein Csm2 small subunit
VLSIAIYKYKRIKTDLMLNLKYLRKSINLSKELIRTLYNKKLRNKEEKRCVGALKNILIEKISDSLKHFTSRNITL